MRTDKGADLCFYFSLVDKTQGAALELMFVQKNNEYLTLITSPSLPSFQQQISQRQASKFSLALPHSPQLTLIISNVTLIKKLRGIH